MVFFMFSPTTIKGNTGQAAVIFEAVSKGYGVSIPFEGCAYDLIVDRNGRPERVQVKYVSPRLGCLRIDFDSSLGKNYKTCRKSSVYNSSNCDAVVVYNPENKKVYWVPVSRATTKTLLLRLEPSKNNQTKGVTWASEFEEW